MTSYKLPALICMTGLALTASAQAADMAQLPPPAPPLVQEFFSAWYVRLDGGYRASSVSDGTKFGVPFTDSKIHDAGTIGGGFGFKWDWLRSDITFDYGSQPLFQGFIGPGAAPAVTAKMTNFTTLWNAYLDLGSWWGFTPYFGAGVGTSYLKPADFLTSPVIIFPTQNEAHWTFAWAGMAGASYALTPGLLIDASYRYLDLGRAATNVPAVGEVRYGNWTANEVRVGLRYLLP